MIRLDWRVPWIRDDDYGTNIYKDDNPHNYYPEEVQIYRKIEEHHSVSMDNVAIGFGIGELYPRIVNTFINKTWSITTPTWLFASKYMEVLGKDYNDFNSDIHYIANPCGVDGTKISRQDIIEMSKKYELLVVDEAYGDFADESVIGTDENFNNIIVLKSLSKNLGTPGLRFGYAIGPKEIILRVQEMRPDPCMHDGVRPEMFDEIATAVNHAEETKEYIEKKYKCRKSYINSVFFRKHPGLDIKMKGMQDGTWRLSLMPLEKFKKYEQLRKSK